MKRLYKPRPILDNWARWAAVLLLATSLVIFFKMFYPETRKLIKTYSIAYSFYEPTKIVKSQVDTSKMPPAKAVPILMYHGITDQPDHTNTTREVFISHMEMLKREGYQTISVAEFDQFR